MLSNVLVKLKFNWFKLVDENIIYKLVKQLFLSYSTFAIVNKPFPITRTQNVVRIMYIVTRKILSMSSFTHLFPKLDFFVEWSSNTEIAKQWLFNICKAWKYHPNILLTFFVATRLLFREWLVAGGKL